MISAWTRLTEVCRAASYDRGVGRLATLCVAKTTNWPGRSHAVGKLSCHHRVEMQVSCDLSSENGVALCVRSLPPDRMTCKYSFHTQSASLVAGCTLRATLSDRCSLDDAAIDLSVVGCALK